MEKEQHFLWYDYKEQATEDFYNSYSTYPGLVYVFKNIVLAGNVELWLRIEVEHSLFFGLCVFDSEHENQLDIVDRETEEEIMKYFNLDDIKEDSWWIDWWYLPTGTDNGHIDSQRIPNFKEMNEAAVRLSGEDNLHNFVKECVWVIERTLSKVLK